MGHERADRIAHGGHDRVARRTAPARSDAMLAGLGILAVWIALQVWVLPRLGVPG